VAWLTSFIQRIRPGPRLIDPFRNTLAFYGEVLLAPRPTPKLEDHPSSFVRSCVFNIFAATRQCWRPSLQSATRRRAKGTHLTWVLNKVIHKNTTYVKCYRLLLDLSSVGRWHFRFTFRPAYILPYCQCRFLLQHPDTILRAIKNLMMFIIHSSLSNKDCLSGIVVRVTDNSLRGPGFDFRPYQSFWVAVGVERGPLSLVRINERLLERTVAAPF
jgi:hypothetical protein